MLKVIKYCLAVVVVTLSGLSAYILWPMLHTPTAASCECLSVNNHSGKLVPLQMDSNNVYGVALTYPGIIYQTGSEYHPDVSPPVFRKLKQAINTDNTVSYPNQNILLDQIEKIEPGLSRTLHEKFNTIHSLLDYEVELGIVLLNDISREQLSAPSFSPKLAYFLANDLQSITLAVLGLGMELESEYFNAKGSFPGFLPVSKQMWIPNAANKNSTFCIDIQTTVNNELRQRENTKNRIYSNKEILGFVLSQYNKKHLTKGTAIITGSPEGVANKTPRWKRRLAKLLRINRLEKLSSMFNALRSDNQFLKPGDVVVVEGAPFGSIRTDIVN